MRKIKKIVVLRIIFIAIFLIPLYLLSSTKNLDEIKNQKFQKARDVVQRIGDRLRAKHDDLNQVVIASVACSLKQFELVVTLVKSAVLLSSTDTQHRLNFVIVTKKELFTSFTQRFNEIQKFRTFSFILREINFPRIDHDKWMKLGVTEICMAQKIFFPSLLSDFDTLLYLNPESIFLSPPHETFKLLRHFKRTQIAGLAAEEKGSVYDSKKGHPFYGANGINSGVMLMNLKKMRENNWQKEMQQILAEYHSKALYGDQDLINIYFNSRPNEVYDLPCDYNFRTDQCDKSSACATPEGIKIFQANRDVFFGSKNVIFRHIHGIVEKVK